MKWKIISGLLVTIGTTSAMLALWYLTGVVPADIGWPNAIKVTVFIGTAIGVLTVMEDRK